MLVKSGWILAICTFLVISLHGQSSRLQGNGSIDFVSNAPLEIIDAASPELKGIIDISNNEFAFTVPIISFEGFNSPLQREHFNENYLESSQFPNATFVGKIIEDLDYSTIGKMEIRAKGSLSIHGVVSKRIIPATIDIQQNSISIEAKFLVPLVDHNIRIPKIVYMKIAEEINVVVSAEFAIN